MLTDRARYRREWFIQRPQDESRHAAIPKSIDTEDVYLKDEISEELLSEDIYTDTCKYSMSYDRMCMCQLPTTVFILIYTIEKIIIQIILTSCLILLKLAKLWCNKMITLLLW